MTTERQSLANSEDIYAHYWDHKRPVFLYFLLMPDLTLHRCSRLGAWQNQERSELSPEG